MQDPKSNGNARNVGPLVEGTTTVRVTYADTDQMGFVYYANFFVYFEIGRTELLRGIGSTYRDCEEAGILLPVIETYCNYHTPARYDDLLEVRSRVTKWSRAAIDFSYEVMRPSDQEHIASGYSRHAITNRDGRIIRAGDQILPEALRQRLATEEQSEESAT